MMEIFLNNANNFFRNFRMFEKNVFIWKQIWMCSLFICIVLTLPKCECNNNNNNLNESSEPTYIKPQRTHYTVRLGDTLIMPCEIKNLKTSATVIWQYSKNKIPETLTVGFFYYRKDFRIRVITNITDEREQSWNLEIRKVKIDDEGYYYCKVMAQPESLKRVISLKVDVDMSLHPQNPVVNLKDNLALTCTTSFVPHESSKSVRYNSNMRIQWFKDGELIEYNQQHNNTTMSSVYRVDYHQKPTLSSKLKIHSFKTSDIGTYTCKFRNQTVSTTVTTQNSANRKYLEIDNLFSSGSQTKAKLENVFLFVLFSSFIFLFKLNISTIIQL